MTFLEIPQRHRMVETAMDAYVNWREESRAVSSAFRRWADSHEADAESAWRAYEAAHAAEEDASLLYLQLAQQRAGRGANEGLVISQGAGVP
jgi:hypothetical protein